MITSNDLANLIYQKLCEIDERDKREGGLPEFLTRKFSIEDIKVEILAIEQVSATDKELTDALDHLTTLGVLFDGFNIKQERVFWLR